MPLEAHSNAPARLAGRDKTRQVEILISTLLRVGVLTSLTVVVAGTVLSFWHHPDYRSSRDELARLTRPGAAFPRTATSVLAELKQFRGRAVVVLGLLLLVATPVMRVAVSVFAFIYERDRTFVIITATVLALLLLSFALGKATG
jgi:uncharacterized membrane protein